MMAKIMKLTPEQEAELPLFRQRYLDIACGGGRIDRAELQVALNGAYARIGKPAPRLFIFDSPAACMLALKIFKLPKTDQLWDQLWDQLGGQLGGQLRDQLGDQLRDQLRGQLRDQLGGQLGGQLGDQLWGQLWDQLRDQHIYDPNFLWGSHDLYWIAWARFAQAIGVELRVETDRDLAIMERIAVQCEWWWPYENIVVASERPTGVRWDDQRRLHCETGPAIRYSDGYELFAWHGVRIPPEWVADKAITPEDALRWPNMEQRRAACEILGWDLILDRLGGRTIDRDADPQVGELIRVNIPDIGEEQFLRVTCGTGRRFALPVPPNMTTALQANAWTYGLDADQYAPEVRT